MVIEIENGLRMTTLFGAMLGGIPLSGAYPCFFIASVDSSVLLLYSPPKIKVTVCTLD